MAMKKLFYVRHGQTKMNEDGLFSGRTETPLTDKGRGQALDSGKYAKANLPKIDLIVCSTIERAVHTAEIIAKELDYPQEKIVKSPLFIERTYGELEGTPGKAFYDYRHPRELETIKGVETLEQMHTRAEEALKFLEDRPEANILVVGHGTFGRAFRRVVNKLPHTHEYEKTNLIGNSEILELI
jgi:broad specificity phosphatase PhoE